MKLNPVKLSLPAGRASNSQRIAHKAIFWYCAWYMDQEELRLEQEAFEFIKSHKAELIKQFVDLHMCESVVQPVSLFMAGSPGAGKTEVSKSLVSKFNDAPVRIDADEIRAMCPGYTGLNAHVFQKAANKGVNILFDYALRKNLNLILDGTFAYNGAMENIRRSIEHKRLVQLWFVYQNPLKAWEVTKAREVKETRHVSKNVFIESFFEAKKNVRDAKIAFGKDVELNLLMKDYDEGESVRLNIGLGELDQYLADGYTESDLKRTLV